MIIPSSCWWFVNSGVPNTVVSVSHDYTALLYQTIISKWGHISANQERENMDIEALMTPERLEKDVEHLKEWLSKQPHLPKIDDEEWLGAFLHHNKYSLEKTKRKLDNYFSYKNRYPSILKNRDPLGEDIKRARGCLSASLAKTLTKDGERIVFGRFNPDSSLFNVWSHLKYGFMVFDTLYLENDRHKYIMFVNDCKDLSHAYFLKALPGIKAGVDLFFSAYPDRLKAFHMINCPPGLEFILNAFKAFFPPKLAQRFYFHSSSDGLIKMVDEDVICSDFGGKGPTLAELDEYTAKLLEKHRKWFLEQDDVTTNEELRPKTGNEMEDLKGSFRKLEVD